MDYGSKEKEFTVTKSLGHSLRGQPLESKLEPRIAKLCVPAPPPKRPDPWSSTMTGKPYSMGEISNMDIHAVSFIGSTKKGCRVMQAAAMSNLKPVSLELGILQLF